MAAHPNGGGIGQGAKNERDDARHRNNIYIKVDMCKRLTQEEGLQASDSDVNRIGDVVPHTSRDCIMFVALLDSVILLLNYKRAQ